MSTGKVRKNGVRGPHPPSPDDLDWDPMGFVPQDAELAIGGGELRSARSVSDTLPPPASSVSLRIRPSVVAAVGREISTAPTGSTVTTTDGSVATAQGAPSAVLSGQVVQLRRDATGRLGLTLEVHKLGARIQVRTRWYISGYVF